MARVTPLSGFPEWTPAQRIVEQQVLDVVRRVFELHGFASLETRAVEPLDVLLRKGEIDKEVYGVRRLAGDESSAADAGLALHFDLTVPFARYVLEHSGELSFPFRRYQIQKAWRGERPQEGRYREFTQADVDIVGSETLAAHHDVELPLVTLEALEKLHVDFRPPRNGQALDGAGSNVSARGIVADVVYTGAGTRYVVDLADGARVVALQQNVQTSSMVVLQRRGAEVLVSWDRTHCFELGKQEEEEEGRED